MAEAIAALATYATGTTVTFTALQAFAINTVIAVGVAAYQQDQARKKANEQRRNSYQDRELTIRSGTAPLRIVYGEDRVGAVLVDAFNGGAHGEYLHLVLVLAGHQCEAIPEIWYGNELLPEPDAQGYIQSGTFVHRDNAQASGIYNPVGGVITLPHNTAAAPYLTDTTVPDSPNSFEAGPSQHTPGTNVITGLAGSSYIVNYTYGTQRPLIRIRKHLGQPGQVADPTLIAESNGRWTSSMVGNGIAYLYVRIEFDDIFSQTGLEEFVSRVRGRRLFDPRNGAGSTAWSDNAALVVRDWLRDDVFGVGAAAEEVAEFDVAEAANICDEGVRTQGIYSPTYVAHFIADAEGWAAAPTTGGTLTQQSGYIRHIGGSDPRILRNGLSLTGSDITAVRARIRRTAGTGWEGRLYWRTPGHDYSIAQSVEVPQPAPGASGWAVVEWPLNASTAPDWVASTITGLQLDIGVGTGDTFDVDWIAAGGTVEQKRYVFNGSFTTDQTPRQILSDILLSMASPGAVYAEGRWLIRPGAYRAPALTITERMLNNGGVTVDPDHSRTNLYNAVRAIYRGADTGYVELPAPVQENAQYTAADGGTQRILDLRLPFLCDSWRAQRLARIMLERERQALTAVVNTNLRAYDLLPTDSVRMSLQLPGWVNKTFAVRSRTFDLAAGGLQYELIEDGPHIYAWNDGIPTVGDPEPDTSLRSPTQKPARIAGLTADSSSAQSRRIGDTSFQGRVLVTWTAITDTYVTQGGWVDVEWWPATDPNPTRTRIPRTPGADTRTYIDPAPQVDSIIISARAVNALGVASDWTYRGHVVGDQTVIDTGELAPGAVTQAFLIEALDFGQQPPVPVYMRARSNSGAAIGAYDAAVQGNSVNNLPYPISIGYFNNTSFPVELHLEAFIAVIAFPATNIWDFEVRMLAAKTNNQTQVEASTDQRAEPPRSAMVAHVANKSKPTPPNLNMTRVQGDNVVIARTPISQPTVLNPGETLTAILRVYVYVNGVPTNTGDYEMSFQGSYIRGLVRRR